MYGHFLATSSSIPSLLFHFSATQMLKIHFNHNFSILNTYILLISLNCLNILSLGGDLEMAGQATRNHRIIGVFDHVFKAWKYGDFLAISCPIPLLLMYLQGTQMHKMHFNPNLNISFQYTQVILDKCLNILPFKGGLKT